MDRVAGLAALRGFELVPLRALAEISDRFRDWHVPDFRAIDKALHRYFARQLALRSGPLRKRAPWLVAEIERRRAKGETCEAISRAIEREYGPVRGVSTVNIWKLLNRKHVLAARRSSTPIPGRRPGRPFDAERNPAVKEIVLGWARLDLADLARAAVFPKGLPAGLEYVELPQRLVRRRSRASWIRCLVVDAVGERAAPSVGAIARYLQHLDQLHQRRLLH